MAKIAVVGAGWAGLAAAVELAELADVTVFEAGKEPGGRARKIRDDRAMLDNGQHILIGAYAECTRLMSKVGQSPADVLYRTPMTWYRHKGIQLRCPVLPAPLHVAWGLLCAKGLSWSAKFKLARALDGLKRRSWRLDVDKPVMMWLKEQGQSAELIEEFWQPMVLSALNTPLDCASMQVLATVLKDSLGGSRQDSDLLIPRRDLSALFPEPAAAWLKQQGCVLEVAHRVSQVKPMDNGVSVDGMHFDAVIVAVAPYHLSALLEENMLPAGIKAFQYWPIYTVYLQFACSVRLPAVMTGIKGGCADWLFDREVLSGEQGLIAGVISAPEHVASLSHDVLIESVLADIRTVVPDSGQLVSARVIVEKRATFASVAGLLRPDNRTSHPSLFLAGDWVVPDYPATLEGAVQSGVRAASMVKTQLGI